MGYGNEPRLVYGVKERRNSACILCEDLGSDHIMAFATEVSKGYAMDIVYGCVVELDDFKTGAVFEGKGEVDSFAEKFADLFKSPKPSFTLALSGDFEVRHYYNLNEDAVKEYKALLVGGQGKSLGVKETQGKTKKRKSKKDHDDGL